MAPNAQKRAKRDLNELKRELELDEHRIPIADLYRRLKCNSVTVGLFSNYNLKKLSAIFILYMGEIGLDCFASKRQL